MQSNQIPFSETGYFSKFICNYISQSIDTKRLYGNFYDRKGFENQIEKREAQFSEANRKVLVASLEKQYNNIQASELTTTHIQSLLNSKTFTVTTGHQLNLFTGPLYFLYKIVSTINLTRDLNERYPEYNFVPVYWMATEDHDFEEINHFFVKNKKVTWDVACSGPVGRHSTKEMDTVFDQFSDAVGNNANANYLKTLFKKAYIEHSNLSDATRYLVNELFGGNGLVIIDGDDKELKREFAPYAQKELQEQYAHKAIEGTNKFLEAHYKVQVNPREINLFYIKDTLRERIVYEDANFKVKNTDIVFSKNEIIQELELNPECFSPNVIMRPLYQEVILPNLCYIGGGGELAYWLQLKEMFTESDVLFPILLLRNSVALISKKQKEKLARLKISNGDLFLNQEELVAKKIKEASKLPLDFSHQKEMLQKIFQELEAVVEQTDKSFEGALAAQTKKQTKGIANLEQRLLKAEKRKHADLNLRIRNLQDVLFPRKGLQERNVNFAEFYAEYGNTLIPTLLENLNPLDQQFTMLCMEQN